MAMLPLQMKQQMLHDAALQRPLRQPCVVAIALAQPQKNLQLLLIRQVSLELQRIHCCVPMEAVVGVSSYVRCCDRH